MLAPATLTSVTIDSLVYRLRNVSGLGYKLTRADARSAVREAAEALSVTSWIEIQGGRAVRCYDRRHLTAIVLLAAEAV